MIIYMVCNSTPFDFISTAVKVRISNSIPGSCTNYYRYTVSRFGIGARHKSQVSRPPA